MYIFSTTTPRRTERVQVRFWVEGGVNAGIVEKICSGAVAHIPEANIKEFLGTIRSEPKRPQIPPLSKDGEFSE